MKLRQRMPLALLLLTTIVLGSLTAYHQAEQPPANSIDAPEVAQEMAVAADRFLKSLEPGMQAKYLFKDAERGNFHFFPIARRGVPLADLNAAQRQLAYALMCTGLSHDGMQKAFSIMSLGEILKQTDEQPNVYRDSDQYYFTVFGEPTPDGTWGYRVEGFHLSLNVTIINGRWISVTPSFFGAIPAVVSEGPRQGLEVLQQETQLGRALAKSFTEKQREIGFGEIPVFAETVGGLITGNERRIERGKPRGVAAGDMTPQQRDALMALVREHIRRIRKELADQDLARIDKAGVENIHFVWAGGLEPGEPHHYLIQGPTFLIEYDNTQDGADHIHCVYRDFDNDFGDVLLEHYQKHGHHHQH